MLLPTRKLRRTALIESAQAYLFQRLPDTLAYQLSREILSSQTESDILEDTQMGEEGVVLKDVTKGTVLGRYDDTPLAVKIRDAVESNIPPFWMELSRKEPQNCALACAALTEQNSRSAHFGRKTEFQMEGIEMSVK